MKKTIIPGAIILTIILPVALLGFYKFNFTDDDIYYSGEQIQPESYKFFQGSWILENSEFEEGFTLNSDSTASSINMTTLIYKKWKIEDSSKLVLTAINLGNHTASVIDDKYTIISFNQKRILLEKDGNVYSYKKPIKTDTSNEKSLITSFEYFPADVVDINKVPSTKHPIDFKSNPRASHFTTVISEKYSAASGNFGGYYVITPWGCVTGCLKGAMIDTRDGKIYNLPTKNGYHYFGGNIENISDSILLKTFIFQPIDATIREVKISSWLWNESAKEFINDTSSKTEAANFSPDLNSTLCIPNADGAATPTDAKQSGRDPFAAIEAVMSWEKI